MPQPSLTVGARVKLKEDVMFGPIMELTVERVFKNGKAEASSDDRKTRVKVFHGDFIVKPVAPACPCVTCDDQYRDAMGEFDENWWQHNHQGMILCPECGNKRCPRATHHDNPCTQSNALGQPGSIYAGVKC